MTTQDLEVCGDSFALENNPGIPKKRVGRYCGTYTGKVIEIPMFTLRLHLSETNGVAPGGKRRAPGRIGTHKNYNFIGTTLSQHFQTMSCLRYPLVKFPVYRWGMFHFKSTTNSQLLCARRTLRLRRQRFRQGSAET